MNKIELPASALDEAREKLKRTTRVFVVRRGDAFKVVVRRPRDGVVVAELRDYDFYTDVERYDNYVAIHRCPLPWCGK